MNQIPVKYPSFFQNVSKINIGIKKIRIQGYSLLKMVNSEPNFSLGIENAAKIAPCDRKVWSCLNGF